LSCLAYAGEAVIAREPKPRRHVCNRKGNRLSPAVPRRGSRDTNYVQGRISLEASLRQALVIVAIVSALALLVTVLRASPSLVSGQGPRCTYTPSASKRKCPRAGDVCRRVWIRYHRRYSYRCVARIRVTTRATLRERPPDVTRPPIATTAPRT